MMSRSKDSTLIKGLKQTLTVGTLHTLLMKTASVILSRRQEYDNADVLAQKGLRLTYQY